MDRPHGAARRDALERGLYDHQEGAHIRRKINAILKYREYTHTWIKRKFLPKFAYLEDTELESLLTLGREIEAYASEIASKEFTHDDFEGAKDEARRERVRDAIHEKFPYLDADRLEHLTNRAIFYSVY